MTENQEETKLWIAEALISAQKAVTADNLKNFAEAVERYQDALTNLNKVRDDGNCTGDVLTKLDTKIDQITCRTDLIFAVMSSKSSHRGPKSSLNRPSSGIQSFQSNPSLIISQGGGRWPTPQPQSRHSKRERPMPPQSSVSTNGSRITSSLSPQRSPRFAVVRKRSTDVQGGSSPFISQYRSPNQLSSGCMQSQPQLLMASQKSPHIPFAPSRLTKTDSDRSMPFLHDDDPLF
eukprot:TRINITY_DN7586_c0_g1_i1.p1 TRINITY_DN7586_c0_g1~~TRINITY_DN7586_c0_g1_i1.p1  ORF type:complete len:234 (+),score=44.09 TRINITY_DN7586_c0_g1_i1:87-788(+)